MSFVKWPGGKRRIANQIIQLMPDKIKSYSEPFLGGGAVYFALVGSGKLNGPAYLSDINHQLINAYKQIRDNVGVVISELQDCENNRKFYYFMREIDPTTLSPQKQAVRFIYLNRTCFSGMYRVNGSGRFNTPFGNYKDPKICDQEALLSCSKALKQAELLCCSYKDAKQASVVYMDPPYDGTYVKYTTEAFNQTELAEHFSRLCELDSHVILSNSDTTQVRELYKGYKVHPITVQRGVGPKRSGIKEVLIYEP